MVLSQNPNARILSYEIAFHGGNLPLEEIVLHVRKISDVISSYFGYITLK